MEITLEKLQPTDAKKLYEFELENRGYFEKMVPSRGEDYYYFETFKIRHEALLDEQTKGQSYYYLIKNEKGLIIGRMNLIDIDKSRNLGYIGYRVGKAYTGKGVANKALKLFLCTISKQGIKRILAKTTTNNKASQKVLDKNGFKYISTSDEEFEMNGNSLKFVYYKWTI
ncbi:GNAT family N-acetyltransferase [Anaerobacillus alkalidiazotrophicus]|uniref:GNAT family N-acetyltransferase n=1 Tax=Anaerobacillus alkalidiazotrophicus TaxID=472963 RepID=A0A1S2MAB1_9BACI|nr:GNAT family N-acetyltransferase [Anaerobacillus alkalidiazotrophicus]OIJ20757.1 GNAT family N-acetyltransferase [Anaerobacillus alkalidiazotrophicus]